MRHLLLGLAGAVALAGAPSAALHAQDPGRVQLDTFTLSNGLRVILAPDTSTQVVAVNVWYDVGARNEVPGRTGFAHLFEHMMFQGSENVPKGDHMSLIERAGGNMNGSTTVDRTNYYEVLPSNRLNLGLWLEADRMRSLAVTDENLKNQKEAVKEERRLRFDNQPYIGSYLRGLARAYDENACFAYGHELIGSMADLDSATTADVKAFFDMYYKPNNAILTVVGDFRPAEARRMIQEYFGSIPRGVQPPEVRCDVRFSAGQKRMTETDRKATLPAILHVYLVPEYSHADHPALELLATILGQGESSRMNRAIAREAKAALAVQVGVDILGPTRAPSTMAVLAIANQGVSSDSLDRLVASEVARVAAEGITDAELTKAKNAQRSERIFSAQRAMNVAEAVQAASMFLGSPHAVNTSLDRYMRVTRDDVQRVARTYLRPDNSTVILIKPETPQP